MLAPITELHYTETPLLELNLASLARYPAFAAELTDGDRPADRLPASAARSRWRGTAPISLRCATCTPSHGRSASTPSC